MERGNTKQEILEASLDLFSVQGFEATSISQIASAVGIRKASRYSHFGSKQAILDALVKDVLEQYADHSIFAKADWDKYDATAEKKACCGRDKPCSKSWGFLADGNPVLVTEMACVRFCCIRAGGSGACGLMDSGRH